MKMMENIGKSDAEGKPCAKPRGRPLAFKADDALKKALHVFWARGYEAASMAELSAALGMNKPSIYAAFGNKEALFRKALDSYCADYVAFVAEALHEPSAQLVAQKFLSNAVDFLSCPNQPAGCMIVQGALSGSKDAAAVQATLAMYRKNYEDALRARFELAKTQGDLATNSNPAQLAKYLATLHQGLSVQATSGATRDELMAVVDMALQSLMPLLQLPQR